MNAPLRAESARWLKRHETDFLRLLLYCKNNATSKMLEHLNCVLRDMLKWKRAYLALAAKVEAHCQVVNRCLRHQKKVAAEGGAEQGPNYDTVCVVCNVNQCEWAHVHKSCIHVSLCSTCAPLCADKCPICTKQGTLLRVHFSGVSSLLNNVAV